MQNSQVFVMSEVVQAFCKLSLSSADSKHSACTRGRLVMAGLSVLLLDKRLVRSSWLAIFFMAVS